MKLFAPLLSATLSGLAFATAYGAVPEGVESCDWSGIRAAHDDARHAAQRQEDGHLVARNPGQHWRAEFDGKGFTVTPDQGGWTWGLDLTGYGNRTLSSAASPSQLHNEGGKITCQRDESLTEWFVNDGRGLEQGWDLQQRPERADPAAPLRLSLAARGNVRPQVSPAGDIVSFQQESGSSALTYGGLKAWDADGKVLPVRFEQDGENGIRIAVDDQSARYPVTIDPVAQQTYLKPSNTSPLDGFGTSVAISGNTVVVGSPGEDGEFTGTGDPPNWSNSGAIYVFVRSGTTWIQQAYLKANVYRGDERTGMAVAISGDTIVVGAPYEASVTTGVNSTPITATSSNDFYSGAAYVFTRSGTTWTQQAYLKASNTGGSDIFGTSVAVSGDTVVVGAPGEDSSATGVNGDQANDNTYGSGAAYVFTRNGTTWSQQAYLKASDPTDNAAFGKSLGISGDTVIVGASGANNAYVFTRSAATWTQQTLLKPSNPVSSFAFGCAAAISGDTAVVGANGEQSSATGVNGDQTNKSIVNAGAAYVFTRSGTSWAQQAYLKASNTEANDKFGSAVAVSGDKVVVGAPLEDSAAAGPDGNQADNAAVDSGAAYVFTRNGTSWAQQAYLKATNTRAGDLFGTAVAVSGDTAVVAAPSEDSDDRSINGTGTSNYAPDSGAVYVTEVPGIVIRAGGLTGDSVPSGKTKSFGPLAIGDSTEMTFGLYNFNAADLQLTGTPNVGLTGSGDFTVTAQPGQSVIPWNGFTSFKVRFASTMEGPQTATLSIPNSNPSESPFIINLTARGLSYTTDTDGDGLSDATELKLTPLGFDWQVKQTTLVNTYLANANRSGYFTPAQVQAIRAGTPLIARDPASGGFKLTTHWQKSADLTNFSDFPAPAGSAVSINPSGDIEFEFASPDNAALLRIDHD